MAGLHFGVDSARRADATLHRLKGKPKVFDLVTKLMGRMPEFWCRYLHTCPNVCEGLTREEAKFIFTRSDGKCKILPIYRNNNKAGPLVWGDRDAGRADANNAILTALREIHVPGGVWIYADIEPEKRCNPDWFLGWWERMLHSPYGGRGGVYANPLKTAEFVQPYCKALSLASPDDLFGQALQSFPDDHIRARYIWSQEITNRSVKPGFIPSEFSPKVVPCCRGMTVLWQYGLGCFAKHTGDGMALCDLDLADDLGYSTMWDSAMVWQLGP
jgi:hypothetical protein